MTSLWMIAASLTYAGMGALVKLAAQQGVPVAQIVFFRCLISLLAVWAYLRLRHVPLATPHWRRHMLRSVTGVGSLMTYFPAITLLPLATAMTLNYTAPLLVATIMLLSRSMQVRFGTIATVALGFFGVALILRPTISSNQWLGVAMALASALLSAGSVLSMRRLGQLGEPAWRTVFYFTLSATVITCPWYLLSSPWLGISPTSALLVFGVGLLATAGQLMITFCYQRGETLVTASLGYTQVAFSVLFGWWIWREAPAGDVWLGIPLIVASGIATLAQRRSVIPSSPYSRRDTGP